MIFRPISEPKLIRNTIDTFIIEPINRPEMIQKYTNSDLKIHSFRVKGNNPKKFQCVARISCGVWPAAPRGAGIFVADRNDAVFWNFFDLPPTGVPEK